MSTVKANDLQNASGGIPTVKGQRLIPTAWVNFNGTGTVAIQDAENVSSVTDVGTGDYTINFTTAMSDTNYVAVPVVQNNRTAGTASYATTSIRLTTRYQPDGVLNDTGTAGLTVLGGQA